MKKIEEISFLTKPKINVQELTYVLNTKKVYANLFEINLKKKIDTIPISLYC